MLYVAASALALSVLLFRYVSQRRKIQIERPSIDILTNLVALAILWPLPLGLRPSLFTDPKPLYKRRDPDQGRRPRVDPYGWIPKNPGRCSEILRYSQRQGRHEKAFGTFTFRTEDLAKRMARPKEPAGLFNDEERWVYDWINNRDRTDETPAEIPDSLRRFRFLAEKVVKAGLADAYCEQCQSKVESSELISEHDPLNKPGWSFSRYLCPSRHTLLVVEKMHTMVG